MRATLLAIDVIGAIGKALWIAFAMFWEILWPLILGFTFSGVVQAVISKKERVAFSVRLGRGDRSDPPYHLCHRAYC
jgi:hypothetical protein